MNIRNVLSDIQSQEMDRKDFLKYTGIVLLGVLGIRGLIAALSQRQPNEIVKVVEQRQGFGGGKYGG